MDKLVGGAPLSVLKRSNTDFLRKVPNSFVGVFFFRIKRDDFGAYVECFDKKAKVVSPDPQRYTGAVGDALELYSRLLKHPSWQLDWGRVDGRIYLTDSSEFTRLLLECSNVILPTGEVLESVNLEKRGYLKAKAGENNGVTTWEVSFCPNETRDLSDFEFLTPSLVVSRGAVYAIEPVNDPSLVNLFNCTLSNEETEKFLSIFLSTFPGARFEYCNYKVEKDGKIKSGPALILEKVDSVGALYLTVAVSAEEVDVEFLNGYDLSKIVSVDREAKTIKVRTLVHFDPSEAIINIEKLLKRHQNKSNPEQQYERLDNLFILQSKLAFKFLESELHHLLADFVLIGAGQLKKFNIRSVKPRLNLKVGSGIDFLEGDADIEIGDEKINLSDFLNSFTAKNYIVLSDGTRAIVEHGFINRLKRFLKKDKDGKYKVSFFDLPLVADMIDEKTASKGFLESRKILSGFNTIHDNPPKLPKLNVSLREYQKKGFNWLVYLKKHNLGGCLADDMGLGKTVQSIALLATVYPKEKLPSLIVMPRSLLFNWQKETSRFAPNISTIIYHGQDRSLTEALKYNIIFTTYAVVRNDIEKLNKKEFAFIILDESQKIKNIDSKISRAVMLLSGRWKLALSGTPVENNLGELYSLYRFLNPAMFGSLKDFQRDFFAPIARDGDEQAMADLKKKIYPFILRRLKSDVLKELPDKTEQIIYVDMGREQAELYEKRRKFYYEAIKMKIMDDGFNKTRFFLFQAMNELRQLASVPEMRSDGVVLSPKRDVLGEYLVDVVGNGHKALVFANYLGALDIMEEELAGQEIKYLKMTGSTRNREALVNLFQTDDEYKVMLMTLKTGGVGLNLTAADYVFIFDPWWNASAENQAVDRVHRIGQKNSVFSYKLITKNTIEEKIIQLQQQKTELVNTLIESDLESAKALSEQDIDFIFSDNGM